MNYEVLGDWFFVVEFVLVFDRDVFVVLFVVLFVLCWCVCYLYLYLYMFFIFKFNYILEIIYFQMMS